MNQVEIERLLQPYPEMLTVNEVAAVLRVHPRSVQRWAREGRFASVRAGKTYRIPRVDVLRWMLSISIVVAQEAPTTPVAHANL